MVCVCVCGSVRSQLLRFHNILWIFLHTRRERERERARERVGKGLGGG